MSNQLKGHLELALLRVLADGERHGYAIVQLLNLAGDDSLKSGEGTIYPLLRKLEKEGQLIARWEDGKRLYRLSAQGRGTFKSKLENWKSFSKALNQFLNSPPKEIPS